MKMYTYLFIYLNYRYNVQKKYLLLTKIKQN